MAKYKPYRYPLYLLVRFVAGILSLLPRKLALALANGVGYLGYIFVPYQRTKIFENLKLA